VPKPLQQDEVGTAAPRVTCGVMVLCGLLFASQAAFAGTSGAACPAGAVAVAPGTSIQAVIDKAGDGAAFCLKSGVHRVQVVRPRSGQRFYGETGTILNGSRLVAHFRREGRFWLAQAQLYASPRHGECLPSAPNCNQPEALFFDDKPLVRAASQTTLANGAFYLDYARGLIVVVDDPTGRKVELTVGFFAFESFARDVRISNVIVEKYASVAQKGAVHAREGVGWHIEDCEVRLNSGSGIDVGTGSVVRNCDIHHNGQIGIVGNGKGIRIEDNHIWSNNTKGFDPAWEAGGAKIAVSDGVTFRGNHVHDNNGPGLWCDIECRNVLYEGNRVENNHDVGIFHEISFDAVIRNNVLRSNGVGGRGWLWASDIVVAASQDVQVTGNTLTVAAGSCGIVLIDQGRRAENGREYKTRDNIIRGNDMTFAGAPCAGGVSDTKPTDPNFAVIERDNNRFDGNTYRAPRTNPAGRFVWGHEVTDWEGFRRKGLEPTGRLDLF
jgi:parallel beta-helix repeat protein